MATDLQHWAVRTGTALGRFIRREALLLVLLAFTLAVRAISFDGYWLNTDSMRKWEFVRGILEGGALRFDHHTARWGVLFPGLLSAMFLGKAPIAHFVPGFAACLLQTGAVYKCGELLYGRVVGFIAVVVLVLFPPWMFMGVQFMPSVFSAAYLALALYFLLKYWRDESATARYVVGCALAMFAAYLTKVPNLLALPGLLGALYVCHKNWRHVALCCALLLGLFLLETSLYVAFVEELPLGRYSALHANHMGNAKLAPVDSFWRLFDRYTEVNDYWQALLYPYAALGSLVLVSFRFVHRGLWMVTLVSASLYLGLGLAVKSVDPWIPVLPNRNRYFGDGVTLMVIALVGAGAECARLASRASRRWLDSRTSERRIAQGERAATVAASHGVISSLDEVRKRFGDVAGLTLASLVLGLACLYVHESYGSRLRAPLEHLNQLQRQVARTYERGDPIVCYDKGYRALKAVRLVFWPFSMGERPAPPIQTGKLGRRAGFLTKKKLKNDKQREAYLDKYKKKKVLLVRHQHKGRLGYRQQVMRSPKQQRGKSTRRQKRSRKKKRQR